MIWCGEPAAWRQVQPQMAGMVQLVEVVNVRRESAAPARTERHHSATVRVRVQAWLTHSGD